MKSNNRTHRPFLLERLEDRRLLAVGPDGFGYRADPAAYQNLDLTAGAAGVVSLTGALGDDVAAAIPLGSDVVRFYGNTYTGSSALYASSNGLLTFGTPNTEYQNTDLTTTPTQPAIAPLWTDLLTGTAPANVLYKFYDDDANGTRDRLAVEWSDAIVRDAASLGNPITFQAILQLNPAGAASDITFNYPDLVAGSSTYDNGATATVGIKGPGNQGTNRLLVSQNATSSGLIGSGKALKITAPSPLASVSGVAFDDANGNGSRDAGEAAVAGRTVFLDSNNNGSPDATEARQVTDQNGAFFLGGLAAGTYRVRQVLPAGYAATSPVGGVYVATLAAGQNAGGLNFGTRALPGSISGTKWNDINGDGVRQQNEPGIAGWQIYLDSNGDGQFQAGESSRLTAADGSYSFTNLTPGLYAVAEEQRAGWVQTSPGGGSVSLSDKPKVAGVAGRSAAVESAFGRSTDLSQYDPADLAGASRWVIDAGNKPFDPSAVGKTLGATVTKTDTLAGAFVARFGAGLNGKDAAKRLSALGLPFYPLIETQQTSRSVVSKAAPPNDPLFGQEWHLNNTGQTGGPAGNDVGALAAWNTSRGAGVVIGVVDDGVSYTHPDLAPHYRSDLDYDFNGGSATPPADGEHGTSVAGVAAAVGGNGVGVSGAAPDAQLTNLRLIAGPADDATEAAALHYNDQVIGLYNSSWGPTDDGAHLEGPGPLTLATFDQSSITGRGGLGTIWTWAAGNGLQSNDNVNYDGYASNRHVLAVTAIDSFGKESYYAEPGAPILVSAYSSGSRAAEGITTTALTSSGANGYTNSFGGTSSATPLVSGVVALMLSANPNLSARDVKHILVETAVKNDPTDAGWTQNGAGLWVNHKYGFGAVNAPAAVAKALGWKNVGPELSATSGRIAVNAAIPDNNSAGVSSSVNLATPIKTEGVEVVLHATHPRRGDLRVVLTGPTGTQSVLAEKHNDTGANYDDWVFTSTHNWDELAAGTWTLTVTDAAGGNVGTFDSWQLNVYGRAASTAARYVQVGPGQAKAGIDFGNQNLNPPRVVASSFNFQTGHSASLAFSGNVAAGLDSSDLTVQNLDTGATYGASVSAYNAGSNTATVAFAPAVLPDGNYRLTVRAAGVADAQGTPLAADSALDFFALAGDANHDRRIDALDLRTTLIHRGQAGTFADGDFNYDGVVNDADVQVIARKYGNRLAPPPASLAAAPAPVRVAVSLPRAVPVRMPVAVPMRVPIRTELAPVRRPLSLFSELPISTELSATDLGPARVIL